MFKKLLFNADNKVSMTKVGSALIAIAGIVIAVPPAANQAGMAIDIPSSITTIAWLVLFIGGKLGVDGARDAIDKVKTTRTLKK